MDIKVTKENILQALKENKEKAKDYLNDDEKMEKLFQNFEKKLKLIPGVGYVDDAAGTSGTYSCPISQSEWQK